MRFLNRDSKIGQSRKIPDIIDEPKFLNYFGLNSEFVPKPKPKLALQLGINRRKNYLVEGWDWH